jgi:hypothetical protein
MKRVDRSDPGRLHAQRQRIAYEAARLIARHGLQDYQQAKRKAAEQLGFLDAASLPGNAEVLAELRDYQRLFQADEQPRELRLRREAALPAMQFLERFEPRLVGAVLDGSAGAHSPIELQVYCDDAEDFARFLHDANLPASARPEQRLRRDREQAGSFPAWSLEVDGLPFQITVLPTALLRQPPLSPVDHRPMARATLAALRRLLADEPA